jgi:hypothetical protein
MNKCTSNRIVLCCVSCCRSIGSSKGSSDAIILRYTNCFIVCDVTVGICKDSVCVIECCCDTVVLCEVYCYSTISRIKCGIGMVTNIGISSIIGSRECSIRMNESTSNTIILSCVYTINVIRRSKRSISGIKCGIYSIFSSKII